MRKRLLAPIFLALAFSMLFALPAQAALRIDSAVNESGENSIVSMIMANPVGEEINDNDMQALVDANLLLASRFPIAQYLVAMNRVSGGGGQGIDQTLSLYQDAETASIAVRWDGEQADGTIGSSVQSLAIDLQTGGEITLNMLFSDPDAAFAEMEAIIAENIADGLSDYMEYADLLPMPTASFSYDEYGLTVYYPQERYLYFSGRSGAVHFAWHEIDHLIAEESPVYALSRECPGDATGIAEQITTGKLPGMMPFGLGDLLADALAELTLLAEPDYTTESLVYQFEEEALRGFALEIPKYAETDEAQTPISAVRSSRAALFGLVTGETPRAHAVVLLGEPEQTRTYDRDHAADMMLVPGESLLYGLGGQVLQLHFDEADVLHTIILRNAMPETLY